jgi:hypothetical protein
MEWAALGLDEKKAFGFSALAAVLARLMQAVFHQFR